MFNPLGTEQLTYIVDLQLDALQKRLADKRLTLEVTPAAKEWLVLNGFDPVYGARPLRRLVQSAVGDQLARGILAGTVQDGDTVNVDVAPSLIEVDESAPDGFDASVALNLNGTYRLTVALRRALKASTATGGAAVVNLSSMSALRAVTMVPGYSAAKAGIIALTRTLAVKWAKEGIRVNVVVPGTIDTPMTAPMKGIPALIDSEVALIPLGRFGRVEEIAPTIAFLCTEHSSYTSGALFVIDGASDCF
jgi:NAD(P)-dependent dehydrogenase (short-subunit alcohol dehydrogenase family)